MISENKGQTPKPETPGLKGKSLFTTNQNANKLNAEKIVFNNMNSHFSLGYLEKKKSYQKYNNAPGTYLNGQIEPNQNMN